MVQSFRANLLLLLVVTSVLTAGTAWWMSTHKPFDDAPGRTTDIDVVHGNDKRNMRPHIVYEIYRIAPTKARWTMKYGISCQADYKTNPGNPRPAQQVRRFRRMPEYKGSVIDYYIIYRNVEGQAKAKTLELFLVNQYFMLHREVPEWQFRPIPTID